MKTNLNRTIKSVEDVHAFFKELVENGEDFDPSDDVYDINFNDATFEERTALKKLIEKVWEFDNNPHEFLCLLTIGPEESNEEYDPIVLFNSRDKNLFRNKLKDLSLTDLDVLLKYCKKGFVKTGSLREKTSVISEEIGLRISKILN